ncbi:MAG: hypothetical protein MOB07_17975 [Acidobacteria bacterium]|nr:hypothetical protein [Acidobacteriota bacterium]
MSNQPAILRFRGAPDDIEGLAPLTFQQTVSAGVAFELKLPPSVVLEGAINWQAEAAGATATWLKFALPDNTPSGSYEGFVRVGTERFQIVVEVDPQPSILLSPRHLSLQVAPGAEIYADLTVANIGNVTVDLPQAHIFGLFDVKGLDRAVGAALLESTEKGRGRIDRLADEVADNHGGTARVRVQEGAGALAPGEMRHLRALFSFSNRLKTARRYYGIWSLLNLEYRIEIQITGESPTKKEAK